MGLKQNINEFTYLITIITLCMDIYDYAVWGLYSLGVPAVADCPVQNIKS